MARLTSKLRVNVTPGIGGCFVDVDLFDVLEDKNVNVTIGYFQGDPKETAAAAQRFADSVKIVRTK